MTEHAATSDRHGVHFLTAYVVGVQTRDDDKRDSDLTDFDRGY